MNTLNQLSRMAIRFVVAIAIISMASCASTKKSESDMQTMMQMMMMMQQQQQQQQQVQYREQAARENQGKSSLGEEVAKSPAQIHAEDPNADKLRAWSLFNGFEDDNLESVAANNARGELSNVLEVLVENAMSNFTDRISKQGATKDGVAKKKTQDTKVATKLKTVSENLIKGAKVVKTNRYKQPDGTFTAYVCVELDPSVVANAIKNEQEIINAISENEEMRIMWKSKMFDEEMQSSFEKLKAKRLEGTSSSETQVEQ